MKKVILGIVFILIIATSLLIFNKKPIVQSDRPTVKIGISLPLSGDAAVYGESAKQAVKIFFDNFNKDKSFYNYEIVYEDDQFQASKAATGVNKMISINKIDAVLTFMSHIGSAISPIAKRNKVLHMSVATDPKIADGEYNFTVSTSAKDEMNRLIKNFERMKIQTVEFVTTNTSGGVIFLEAFKEAIKGKSIILKATHSINPTDRDFRPLLQKINNSKPDVVVVQLFTPAVSIFVTQYHQQGMKISLTSAEGFSFIEDKNIINDFYYVDAAPASQNYIEQYKKVAGNETTNYSEYVYTMLQVLVSSFEQYAKEVIDTKEVSKIINEKTTGMSTAIGKIITYPKGVIDAPGVLKHVQDGKVVIVND